MYTYLHTFLAGTLIYPLFLAGRLPCLAPPFQVCFGILRSQLPSTLNDDDDDAEGDLLRDDQQFNLDEGTR